MIKTKTSLFTALIFLLYTSCIKDEPLGREADILSFSFPESIMLAVNIDEEDNYVEVTVRKSAELSNLVPVIEITEGATISPSQNTAQDFSKGPVTYTVTSEDGNWHRIYKVEVTNEIRLYFDFEKWNTDGKYQRLSDATWDSGNAGIGLINPQTYPTSRTEDAYEGQYAAMLQTQKGAYIDFINRNIPIFSGSLFRGKFKTTNALLDPVTAPQFGQPHPIEGGKPISFTGYYKYAPGEIFTGSDGNVIPGRTDSCTVRSVLYRVTKGAAGSDEFLTAADITTSEKVVAMAEMKNYVVKNTYTYFDLPFEYRAEIDYDKYDYKLAIIFASSRNGDNYEGAVGSTLIIDEVRILCEPYEE